MMKLELAKALKMEPRTEEEIEAERVSKEQQQKMEQDRFGGSIQAGGGGLNWGTGIAGGTYIPYVTGTVQVTPYFITTGNTTSTVTVNVTGGVATSPLSWILPSYSTGNAGGGAPYVVQP